MLLDILNYNGKSIYCSCLNGTDFVLRGFEICILGEKCDRSHWTQPSDWWKRSLVNEYFHQSKDGDIYCYSALLLGKDTTLAGHNSAWHAPFNLKGLWKAQSWFGTYSPARSNSAWVLFICYIQFPLNGLFLPFLLAHTCLLAAILSMQEYVLILCNMSFSFFCPYFVQICLNLQ